MAEVLDENEEVTLDMIRWWWFKLPENAKAILEDRYDRRFDHGAPQTPPQEDDYDWYLEEYEDAIRSSCPRREFTVIGYYDEDQQRFSDQGYGRTPMEAELDVLNSMDDYDLCVCGVIDPEDPDGMADCYYAVHVSSISNPPGSQPE